jgi:uncharacterized membrane protein
MTPSGWHARAPVLVLAIVGIAIASYLAAYQLHVTQTVWDPVFGSASSVMVITSPLSRTLPVPDAAVGALAYLLEAILTAVGGPDRWCARPWLVITFGAIVAGLTLAGVVLLYMQVFVVHALCSLCLTSAAVSFINAALARDEVAASLRVVSTDARRSIPT